MGVAVLVLTTTAKLAVLFAATLTPTGAVVISALAGVSVIPLKVTWTLLALVLLKVKANSLNVVVGSVEIETPDE